MEKHFFKAEALRQQLLSIITSVSHLMQDNYIHNPGAWEQEEWHICPIDMSNIVKCFPQFALKTGLALHTYSFFRGRRALMKVWAVPNTVPLLPPHELAPFDQSPTTPPRPKEAYADYMEALTSDGSPHSYMLAPFLHALLRDNINFESRFFDMVHVVDVHHFEEMAEAERIRFDELRHLYWEELIPEDVRPTVTFDETHITVVFYSYNAPEKHVRRYQMRYVYGSYCIIDSQSHIVAYTT